MNGIDPSGEMFSLSDMMTAIVVRSIIAGIVSGGINMMINSGDKDYSPFGSFIEGFVLGFVSTFLILNLMPVISTSYAFIVGSSVTQFFKEIITGKIFTETKTAFQRIALAGFLGWIISAIGGVMFKPIINLLDDTLLVLPVDKIELAISLFLDSFVTATMSAPTTFVSLQSKMIDAAEDATDRMEDKFKVETERMKNK